MMTLIDLIDYIWLVDVGGFKYSSGVLSDGCKMM